MTFIRSFKKNRNNMKIRSFFASVMLVMISVLVASAQKVGVQNSHCEVGLLYQISYQPNWGDSHAIVVEVVPGSPAEKAGVRVGDVLKTINGQSTQKMSEEQINRALLNSSEGQVDLELANFGDAVRKVTLRKECYPVGALSEADLAQAFSMYSLEDVTARRFNMPFAYTVPEQRDFIQYKSFSFVNNTRVGEEAEQIKQTLQKKGLNYVEKGGDLLVSVRHSLEANPEYREGSSTGREENFRNYRMNTYTGEIQDFPFLSLNAPAFFGAYRLTLEVEIFDGKDNVKLWSGRATERINASYSTANYAKAFGPLLMANFPYLQYIMNPIYLIHRESYRYLGIHYDSNDLQLVVWVDKGSPADKVGVRPGDRITSINGLPLDSSVEKMSKAYKEFLNDTWDLRDESTIYPNSDGFKQNMYWDVSKYLKVAEKIQDSKYLSAFAYLFSHRTYINSPIIKDIVLEMSDGSAILVTPQLRNRDYITLY